MKTETKVVYALLLQVCSDKKIINKQVAIIFIKRFSSLYDKRAKVSITSQVMQIFVFRKL